MKSMTKISELIKKYICDEWCPQIAKYKKEREFIQRDIIEFLRFYKSKMLYRFGPIGKIRINVNGKSYVVDFIEDNIYIDKEQYFIPYDRSANFFLGEEDEFELSSVSVICHPYDATLYKNFTNNYEDIKIIFRTVDQYLTNQQTTKNPWNMEQKIKKVLDYIIDARKTYTDFQFLSCISSSQDSCLLIDSNDIFNYKNNYYEQFDFLGKIYLYYSDNFLKFCNNILVLNKNLYDRSKDNYFYAKFDPQSHPSYNYNNAIYTKLRNFISFLKYFDINKKILPIINNEENEQKQEIEIKKLLKKILKEVDPKLLNLIKVKLQQSNYNYKKFKNSLYFNFSEADVYKLFYNPRIFYVPLPGDLLSIRKYKVSIYVVNSMFSTGDIKRRKINIQNVDDIRNTDSKKVLSYIKIKFCLDDPYNNDNKFTFSLPLDKYLSYLSKSDGVNDISSFINCDNYDYVYGSPDYYDFQKADSLKEDLSPFITANKFRLLSLILNKMEEHVNMDEIRTKSNMNEIHTILSSDEFLVGLAEDYFDNCI